MTTPSARHPPKPGAAGFGRDVELEMDRGTGRPAAAEMASTEAKADQEPILGPAPDPDVYLQSSAIIFPMPDDKLQRR